MLIAADETVEDETKEIEKSELARRQISLRQESVISTTVRIETNVKQKQKIVICVCVWVLTNAFANHFHIVTYSLCKKDEDT